MRRNKVSAFLEGFNSTYDATKRVIRDKQLNDIETAEATDITTTAAATPAQVTAGKAETDAMAAKDAQEFGLDKPMDYRVPTQTVQKTGTQFLGQEFKGDMTGGQKERAKMIAQAGVLSKSGDVQGAARLRRDAQQSEREDVRFDRETKRYAKEDEADAKTKAYDEARKGTMTGLRAAKIQDEYNGGMQKYIDAQKAYESDKAAGKPVGVAPTPPTRGEYSIGDALADRAALLEVKAKHGKAEDKDLIEFGELVQKVQTEGYTKALRIAQGGAPIEEVAKAFNESGGTKFDPASVVSDKMVAGKDGGPPSRVIQFKDAKGNTRTLPILAELDALDKADKVFTRFYQGKTDARADRGEIRADRADARAGAASGRANASDAEAKKEKQEKADAAEALFKENNPNATTAQLNAVRKGIIEAAPKAGGIESDYKPDGYGQSGTVTQKDKNGNVTITKVDGKGKLGTPVAIPVPGKATAPPPAPGTPKPLAKPPTAADITATAQKYGITEDEVRRRLNLK